MSLTGNSLADALGVTAVTALQDGDLFYVERAGAPGRITFQNMRGTAWTFSAAATFSSTITVSGAATVSGLFTAATVDINGGNIDGTTIGAAVPAVGTFSGLTVVSSSATMTFVDSSGTASTHSWTRFNYNDSEFTIQTANGSGVFVSTDYLMTKGATGATLHSWRVVGTERMYLGNNFGAESAFPGAAAYFAGGALQIGRSSERIVGIYLSNSPNVSSDARLKKDIADLTDAERRAAAKIKTRTFTIRETGQKKVGYIAQEVIEAMASEGLDAFEYGLVSDGPTYGVDLSAVNAFRIEAMA